MRKDVLLKCYKIWDLNLHKNDTVTAVLCSSTKWSKEGLVPSIPPEEFLQLVRAKRQIRAKLIDRQVYITNDKGFKIEQCRTEQYKNSFFVRTAIDWTTWTIRLCMLRQLMASNQPSVSETDSTSCSLSRCVDEESRQFTDKTVHRKGF